jgi:hypothetical protein
MSSLALDTFSRLIQQVEEIEAIASLVESQGNQESPPILRRSAFVLGIAAIDTFFHEQGIRLLYAAAQSSQQDASRVSVYVGAANPGDVAGVAGESHIRMGLSYKTLASPKAIDGLLDTAGLPSADIWRDVSFARGTRPDRLRLHVQLLYDRRNQVAHEGDWDFVQLDFRRMERTHLADCVRIVTELAETMDTVL